ncbi:hypothetical protein AGMMS50256_16230 [Betaproteobacteria bacterium]|nr:hypothetical protein AGMMS50256_16230 [Betaproteobacteria bacterium]
MDVLKHIMDSRTLDERVSLGGFTLAQKLFDKREDFIWQCPPVHHLAITTHDSNANRAELTGFANQGIGQISVCLEQIADNPGVVVSPSRCKLAMRSGLP